MQGNAKTIEGQRHPDRDAQFRYINEQARAHQDSGDPVISVDTKKTELVGEFKNAGRDWRPKGHPAVRAELDPGSYWNYTLRPEPYDQISSAPGPFGQPSPDPAWLAHPALTGLPPSSGTP